MKKGKKLNKIQERPKIKRIKCKYLANNKVTLFPISTTQNPNKFELPTTDTNEQLRNKRKNFIHSNKQSSN